MTKDPDILCIGSVLWDIIGRTSAHMRAGADVPGRITRLPGGVAMNIAMTLRRYNMTPALFTAIGRDEEGDELLARAQSMGMITDHVYRSQDLPTDRYMAIEGANGLIAAIADAHSLESARDKILKPLENGALASPSSLWNGLVALDGNLTEELLSEIAVSPLFAKADLRVAPASPGKAERLLPMLGHAKTTFYVNLEEAGLLLKQAYDNSAKAAEALCARGAARVLVTDGARPASMAWSGNVLTLTPPEVMVTRVTGAGDTFMAAHIAAEHRGETGEAAMTEALRAAADYISHRGD